LPPSNTSSDLDVPITNDFYFAFVRAFYLSSSLRGYPSGRSNILSTTESVDGASPKAAVAAFGEKSISLAHIHDYQSGPSTAFKSAKIFATRAA
jgi:hypothetical protein